jgi:hypothetical protein
MKLHRKLYVLALHVGEFLVDVGLRLQRLYDEHVNTQTSDSDNESQEAPVPVVLNEQAHDMLGFDVRAEVEELPETPRLNTPKRGSLASRMRT